MVDAVHSMLLLEAVRSVPTFEHLDSGDVLSVRQLFKPKVFQRDQVLAALGQPANSFFVIVVRAPNLRTRALGAVWLACASSGLV